MRRSRATARRASPASPPPVGSPATPAAPALEVAHREQHVGGRRARCAAREVVVEARAVRGLDLVVPSTAAARRISALRSRRSGAGSRRSARRAGRGSDRASEPLRTTRVSSRSRPSWAHSRQVVRWAATPDFGGAGDEEALELAAAHTIPAAAIAIDANAVARAPRLVALADLARDFGARPEEPRLHGAVGKVEGLADLVVGEAVQVAEDRGSRRGPRGCRRAPRRAARVRSFLRAMLAGSSSDLSSEVTASSETKRKDFSRLRRR